MAGQINPSNSFHLVGTSLMPQEEMLETGKKKRKLTIGIPREKTDCEYRVPFTPEAVEILVNNGHDVFIESKAGINANYSDMDYTERGGVISSSTAEIFAADVILKVSPLSKNEITHLRERQILFTSLYSSQNDERYFRGLLNKKVTAIGYEKIKDEYGSYPFIQSMSAIAGNAAVVIAGEYLSNNNGGKGVMLGGVPGITPTEVIVLGGDTAAEYSIRAALGFGATVKVFDNSIDKLRRLQQVLAQPLHTSIFHPKVLEKALKSADVIIGCAHNEQHPSFIVTEAMVEKMKKGSVIIDITIGNGGCIETAMHRTHKDPVYKKNGVIHYCVPNLPSRVSRTASIALSNVLLPLINSISEFGGIRQLITEDRGVRKGVYIYNGILVDSQIGMTYNIPSKDIDLLMAAF